MSSQDTVGCTPHICKGNRVEVCDGSVDNDIPPAAEPAKEETPALPATALQDPADVEVMTERDAAICRGIARYLAAVFAPLGNVEGIHRELSRFVEEEVRILAEE